MKSGVFSLEARVRAGFAFPAARRLAAVLLLLVLGGCAQLVPQTMALRTGWPSGVPQSVELDSVPFFPEDDYQCGPAALATVLAHTLGFRAHLFRGEAPDAPADQRVAVFSRYLPYAVVFDVVGRWAQTVADVGANGAGPSDNLYWYEGPAEWDLSAFAESMRTFTLATSGAISASRQFRSLT